MHSLLSRLVKVAEMLLPDRAYVNRTPSVTLITISYLQWPEHRKAEAYTESERGANTAGYCPADGTSAVGESRSLQLWYAHLNANWE
nr:hypothetical protein CFP56_02690 [Quercus suber]